MITFLISKAIIYRKTLESKNSFKESVIFQYKEIVIFLCLISIITSRIMISYLRISFLSASLINTILLIK